MEEALISVPPRMLVLIYCVIWSVALNACSLAYAIYLFVSHPSLQAVALNSLLILVSSSVQSISAFYYLQKYLLVGVRLGWLQLVTAARVARAPRKSLYAWVGSTLVLLGSLLFQFRLLSLADHSQLTPVLLGYFHAGFTCVSFLGIIFGLAISGLFKAELTTSEVIEEEMTSSVRRASESESSPRRRGKSSLQTTIGARSP